MPTEFRTTVTLDWTVDSDDVDEDEFHDQLRGHLEDAALNWKMKDEETGKAFDVELDTVCDIEVSNITNQ